MLDIVKTLIVEDSPEDCDLLIRAIKKGGLDPHFIRVDNEHDMLEALSQEWDIILSDFSLPKFSGVQALSLARSLYPTIPFIITSGTIGEEIAVEVMRAGANDYILKDKMTRLPAAIRRELQSSRDKTKNLKTEKALKETEDQLRHIQKMEAVGQLAGGIAHDFNNMLFVMQLYLKKIKDSGSPEVVQYADKILAIHARSVSLTKQLLIFSRRQSSDIVPLDLNKVTTGMHEMLKSLLGENIDLNLNLAEKLWPIMADQVQLEQVIMNLAVNAHDAMSKGGRIFFSTKNVSITHRQTIGTSELSPGNYTVFEVRDTGVGISRDILSRIFEPFFTTKSVGKGTGLGLSIIYGIVHKMNGSIEVVSTPGSGTQFSIYLPALSHIESEKVQIEKLDKNVGGKETILLVEDEVEILSIFSDMLQSLGYKVYEASDGQAALNLIKEKGSSIHLVISDIVLPKLGGTDLYEKVQSFNKSTKFLFMTGYCADSLSSIEEKIEKLQILQKPFSEKTFVRRVREILDGP